MSQTNSNATKLYQVFIEYCKEKNYHVKVKPSEDDNNDWRLEISNIRERNIVTIYHTDSIVIGGSKNRLKDEDSQDKKKFTCNIG